MNIVAAICLVSGIITLCMYFSTRGIGKVIMLVAALGFGYGFLVLGHIVPAAL